MTPEKRWVVNRAIPEGQMGFVYGPSKLTKSLACVDLLVHVIQGGKWLGRFKTRPARILYIALEDTYARTKKRLLEINRSYGYGPVPEDKLHFRCREPFNLFDPSHQSRLRCQIEDKGITFLVLDTVSRAIPGAGEEREWTNAVNILEKLSRDYGLTILLVDHTRKVRSRSGGSGLEELKGTGSKAANLDFFIEFRRSRKPRQFVVTLTNRDYDPQRFIVERSPKGSTEPKFTCIGAVAEKEASISEANLETVFQVLTDWMGNGAICRATGFKEKKVNQCTGRLLEEGRIEAQGRNRYRKYRQIAIGAGQPRRKRVYIAKGAKNSDA